MFVVSLPSQSMSTYISKTLSATCNWGSSADSCLSLDEGLGDAVSGVCAGDEFSDLNFRLLVGKSEVDDFRFGLWIAYVMYRAKARKDSAEGCIVRIDLKAPRKY